MSQIFLKSSIGGFFVDVIFQEEYAFETMITSNPVQSGSNVNDNAYNLPYTFTFDVAVSDCLESVIPGQFDGLSTRSATAFAIFQMLWQTRVLLEVDIFIGNTMFPFFPMLIKSFKPSRSKSTMNALRWTVVMQQIILTDAQVQPVDASQADAGATSSDPQTTDSTNTGTVSPIAQGILDHGAQWWADIP